jgi:hypothetical protein
MPWTFAHPAAVLPFKRFCPRYLSLPALAIGSMMPDAGYYFGLFGLARYAHTFAGSMLICVPGGFIVLAILFVLRKPLWFLLPQPHRAALAPVFLTGPRAGSAALPAMGVSILLGAWTHNVWDSFTHWDAWAASRISVLQESVFRLGGMEIGVTHVLQHISTLVGVLVLASTYKSWLHSRLVVIAPSAESFKDRWRYGCIAVAAIAASVIAIDSGLDAAAAEHGYLAIRRFVFSAAVSGAAVFIALLVLFSIVLYQIKNGESEQIPPG